MIRPAAVAGSFYPAESSELVRLLETCATPGLERSPAVGVLVPHAGYLYSGAVAGRVYASVSLPRRFVILGPNHTGQGEAFAVYENGHWETPLGTVPVDEPLAAGLLRRYPAARHDPQAHRREHSLEVQIPFLQHLAGDFRFVPLCIGSHRLEELLALGEAIAQVIRDAAEAVLLVISSDMSHYEPADLARQHDEEALEPLERLDAEELHRVVHSRGISMCGIAPAVAGLAAARSLGASAGRRVAYAHSGETTGDFDQVVSYAGLVLS
jgi:MEMO1 family protein